MHAIWSLGLAAAHPLHLAPRSSPFRGSFLRDRCPRARPCRGACRLLCFQPHVNAQLAGRGGVGVRQNEPDTHELREQGLRTAREGIKSAVIRHWGMTSGPEGDSRSAHVSSSHEQRCHRVIVGGVGRIVVPLAVIHGASAAAGRGKSLLWR